MLNACLHKMHRGLAIRKVVIVLRKLDVLFSEDSRTRDHLDGFDRKQEREKKSMATSMRAAVLQKTLHLTIESRTRPEPGRGEVLIRVKAVGVCGSDVHYYTHGRIGPFVVERPMILGHEMAGIIEAIGAEVPKERIGESVAVEPGVPDRVCEFCRMGRYNLCPNINFMATPPCDGALTDYVVVPADFAFKLPEHVSPRRGRANGAVVCRRICDPSEWPEGRTERGHYRRGTDRIGYATSCTRGRGRFDCRA